MTARNDITGDELTSKSTNDNYRAGWDRIFGSKEGTDMKKIFAVNTMTRKAVRLTSTFEWSKLAPHLEEIGSKTDFIAAMHRAFPGPTQEQLANWQMKADQLDDIGFPFQITGVSQIHGSLNGILIVGGLHRQDQSHIGEFLIDNI